MTANDSGRIVTPRHILVALKSPELLKAHLIESGAPASAFDGITSLDVKPAAGFRMSSSVDDASGAHIFTWQRLPDGVVDPSESVVNVGEVREWAGLTGLIIQRYADGRCQLFDGRVIHTLPSAAKTRWIAKNTRQAAAKAFMESLDGVDESEKPMAAYQLLRRVEKS